MEGSEANHFDLPKDLDAWFRQATTGEVPVTKTVCSYGEIYSQLACGHFLKGEVEEGYIRCQEKCGRQKSRNCFHKCEKKCWEDCWGPCTDAAARPIPSCRYNHLGILQCYKKDTKQPFPEGYPCPARVPPLLHLKQRCRHKTIFVACSEREEVTTVRELSTRCKVPCTATLSVDNSCGHPCTGTCAECFRNLFHKRCQLPCGKVLICNHLCSKTCGVRCPPCGLPCSRECAHKKCAKKCGMPCDWECKEECEYRCEHGRCTQPCDQPCDKEPCMEPCSKKYDCGHVCVGFCGEPCPPYCGRCHVEKLMEGAILSGGEVEEEDKFVYLEECQHVVESTCMDQWMQTETDDEEILPKRCPICRTKLRWMPRYSEIMQKNWSLVEEVKRKIFGIEEEIETSLDFVEKRVNDADVNDIEKRDEEQEVFCPRLLDRIKAMLLPNHRPEIYQQMSDFLEWLILEWNHAACQSKKLIGYVLDRDMESMEDRWIELMDFVAKREWPFEHWEYGMYYTERQRLDDHTSLLQVLTKIFDRRHETFEQKKQEYLFTFSLNEVARTNFEAARYFVHRPSEYDSSAHARFKENFIKVKAQVVVTIDLTDAVKKQIVKAFGSHTGKWFKCPKGHVYVITECGGAIQQGMCPEEGCRALIGGVQHRLNEDNSLAPEMDGALESYYDRRIREFQEWVRQDNAEQ